MHNAYGRVRSGVKQLVLSVCLSSVCPVEKSNLVILQGEMVTKLDNNIEIKAS